MNKTIYSLLLAVVSLVYSISHAQEKKIVTGKVISEERSGLAGVTITETGTLNSVLTDDNGNFSISISSSHYQLTFQSAGLQTRQVDISKMKVVTVVLSADVKKLDEVVVVGYGTRKKSDLTGSLSVVKGKDIEELSTKRVDQALQGRAAGVVVQNTDGAPGGKTLIRVRGSNSVLGGNNALIVIDGLQGGNINMINPGDIESVEILKDAAATAIYGSRGANGVLLITTKKGKAGKPVVDYAMNMGSQQVSHWLELLNAGEYARNINAYRMLDNYNNTPIPVFTQEQIAEFDKTGGTDWQKAIYGKALIQNHQLSINGGTDDVKYFTSAAALDQEGILINSGYKRYSFRTNLDVTFNKWLSGGLNLAAVKDDGKSPAFGGESGEDLTLQGAVIVAPRWGPVNPIYNPDGTYFRHPANFGPADTWNPVASSREVSPSVRSTNNTVNIFFDAAIANGLHLNLAGFANIVNTKDTKFYNEKTKQGLPVDGKAGLAYVSNSEYEYYQNSATLTYDKTIGTHAFTVMAVAEQSMSEFRSANLTASKFTSTVNGLNDLSSAGLTINSSSADKRGLKSYLARLNYSFRDKYLLTMTYRADGSSVFGENNKWGHFPSASVAWKLSEESFIKNMNFFSLLKLRSSFGITGNQAIDPYQSIASISSGLNYPWNGGSSSNNGFGLVNPSNPDLKWESTNQTNIGLDLEIFQGRFSATIDLYRKKTTNLLLYRQLATSSGFNIIIDNAGSTENKGLEIELSGTPLTGRLRWNTSLNFTVNRNKVVSLGDDQKIPYITSSGGYDLNNPLMNLVTGEPFGQMYGWGYEGTWASKDADIARRYGQLPGDPKYSDINDDGVINIDDLQVIGNALPTFVYGWNNKLLFKNFDLNFLIQGVYGNEIFNQIRIRLESPSEATSRNILDQWTTSNQNTDVPAFIDNSTRVAANLTSSVFDVDSRIGRWVEDGSYLRLKILALGYTLPTGLLSRYGLRSLRAFISATNLLTITNYSGYDPEVSSYNESDAMVGVDFGNYPSSRTYSIGFSVSL